MPNERTEREDPIIVDINDTSLAIGEEHEFDPKEDWQARACPPPRGRYALAIFVDDEKVEQGRKQGFKKEDPNGVYYRKQLVCKIQDPTGKWQDSITYYNASTGVPKGKTKSSAIGVLEFLRVKLQPRMNDLAIIRLLIKAIQKLEGPILIADCDWGGWDSNNTKRSDLGSTALIAETGKLANTMLNFPKKQDGSYQHIVHTKEGAEIVPKLKVIKWIGRPQDLKAPSAPQQQVNGAQKPIISAPKGTTKNIAVDVVEVAPIQEDLQIPSGGVEFGDDGEVVLDA
jgi:hypothetical protein